MYFRLLRAERNLTPFFGYAGGEYQNLRDKKQMIVTLQSDHLIPYHMITRMEALLTQHAYHMGGAGKKIQIFMRYQLSEQYDVRQIAENYKESLLEELRSISRIAFRLMSRAEWYYNEDVISIAVEHSSVAKEHEKLIRDFLVSYFRDHFGKEIEVGFSYSLEQKTKLRQANALRLQQELRTIEEKNAELQAAKAASDASEKEKNAEDKKGSKDENKQAEAKRLQRQIHQSLHSQLHPVQNQRLQQPNPMAQVPDPIANSQGKAIMEVIASSSHRTRMCSMAETVRRILSRLRHSKKVPVNVVSMDR